MATNDVGSLLQDVIANNQKGNKMLIGAFRTAHSRAAGRVGARVDKALDGKMAARISPAVRKNLAAASKSVTSIWAKRTGQVSDGAAKAVDALFDRTTTTIKSISKRIESVDQKNKYAARYFELLGRAALPGARVAHSASQVFADGAAKLSGGTGSRGASARKRRPAKKAGAARKKRKSAA
ncbi:MAG: hypothetical protein ABW318_09265 [Vicinamibacterales bacterium]